MNPVEFYAQWYLLTSSEVELMETLKGRNYSGLVFLLTSSEVELMETRTTIFFQTEETSDFLGS